jgi:hypothetical protein
VPPDAFQAFEGYNKQVVNQMNILLKSQKNKGMGAATGCRIKRKNRQC